MIIREVIRPGLDVYKVFGADGALMYRGSSEEAAIAIVAKLKELESAASSNDGK